MGLIDPQERRYLEGARVGRLATADADGRPHAVPVCFALVGDAVVTPIDEKPKAGDPSSLRRVRDVRENPAVALVVDHYSDDWSRLGWVQIRGTASLLSPDHADHSPAVAALRERYDQYVDHALEDRPVVRIDVGSVVSWGDLARPDGP
jgi:PPOX class probable F420-dependent enzyme